MAPPSSWDHQARWDPSPDNCTLERGPCWVAQGITCHLALRNDIIYHPDTWLHRGWWSLGPQGLGFQFKGRSPKSKRSLQLGRPHSTPPVTFSINVTNLWMSQASSSGREMAPVGHVAEELGHLALTHLSGRGPQKAPRTTCSHMKRGRPALPQPPTHVLIPAPCGALFPARVLEQPVVPTFAALLQGLPGHLGNPGFPSLLSYSPHSPTHSCWPGSLLVLLGHQTLAPVLVVALGGDGGLCCPLEHDVGQQVIQREFLGSKTGSQAETGAGHSRQSTIQPQPCHCC